MTISLTAKQQAVLDFIKVKVRQDGFPPSIIEMARHFGYRSNNSISVHLRGLEKKKCIRVSYGVSRGIKLLDGVEHHSSTCPHCGQRVEKAAA